MIKFPKALILARMILIDLEKVFHTVENNILLEKLKGISFGFIHI